MAEKLAVLVVEDEVLVRWAVADVLADSGFAVLEAASADEAMLILKQEPAIDIVFTDIDMPGLLNGIDLARHVIENRQEVAVMVTSGQKSRPDALGVDFLPKPYDMDQLEPLLRALKK
ncbi:MAG: response regulator [Devosia sp.]